MPEKLTVDATPLIETIKLRFSIGTSKSKYNTQFFSLSAQKLHPLFFLSVEASSCEDSMGKIKAFKEEFSLDERRKESESIIVKYPDRVPVIIEKYSKTDLPGLDKKKYLVPRDMSVGQFIHVLSSRLRLAPGKALFIFVKNTLPQTASLMNSIYQTYKDDDGFLYMCYSSEKTFG